MNKSITAIEPQRDQYGYWTHPGYFEPANGMEYGAPGEFEAWLDTNRVIGHLQWMESDVTDEQLEALEAGDGDISKWNPTPPAGDGWFIGSIHDTEDGPLCYWLRPIESDPIALKAHIQKCHIEALSQPVAFTDREELDSMRGPDADTYASLWIIPHGFGQDIPLYSQDCIDLLQSDLQVTRDALKSVTELWSDQRQLIAGLELRPQQLAVDELVMQIRRLVHQLKNSNPDSVLVGQVTDYMKRNGYFKVTDCLRTGVVGED
ncbi:hypothetical protein [Serratia fonticola]